jgi:hypothetical protein
MQETSHGNEYNKKSEEEKRADFVHPLDADDLGRTYDDVSPADEARQDPLSYSETK